MNEYEKISDWIIGYAPLNNWIYFNVIRMENGSYSVQSVPGNTIRNKFNDGSLEHDLIFAVSMVSNYSVEMSDDNLDAIAELKSFRAWIEESETLPDFGDGFIVNEIEVLEQVPNLSIDKENSLCNYYFQCRINYLEQK